MSGQVKPFYTLKDFSVLTGIEYKLLYRYFHVYGMPCTQMKAHGTILVNTARALAWLKDNAGRIESNEKYPDKGDLGERMHADSERKVRTNNDRHFYKGTTTIQDIDHETARALGVNLHD